MGMKDLMDKRKEFEEKKDTLLVKVTELEDGMSVHLDGCMSGNQIKASIVSLLLLTANTKEELLEILTNISIEAVSEYKRTNS